MIFSPGVTEIAIIKCLVTVEIKLVTSDCFPLVILSFSLAVLGWCFEFWKYFNKYLRNLTEFIKYCVTRKKIKC